MKDYELIKKIYDYKLENKLKKQTEDWIRIVLSEEEIKQLEKSNYLHIGETGSVWIDQDRYKTEVFKREAIEERLDRLEKKIDEIYEIVLRNSILNS